ncbi:MAG TPA: cation acetate symporter [Candidatus Lustribacter sp.]|nr:cation acetate symporter [Candidatus Lustribacter sp.]
MTGRDPSYAIAAVTVVSLATLLIGGIGWRLSRTTRDFYVAGRSVSPGWNASAIGGEYLSAASFLGVAGLVYAYGVDMLWFPVGYTAGYLVLLVLVAAPLRRSGAYTIPDFAEVRLESRLVRRIAAALVVGIGWLYLLPQFQGAGLALSTVTGAPRWVGAVIVAVVVVTNVVAGGMRSITFVQAVQYWIKLTAISIPAFVCLWLWTRDGQPAPDLPAVLRTTWVEPMTGARAHSVYATYSTILALCFGTMGLPHVLVRFYTNPDGRGARRTTLAVIGLLGLFYLFTPVYGVLGRVYLPSLPEGVRADAVTLLLPDAISPGTLGSLLSAVLAAGAFAAFLSTASGLTISVAGVIDQDLLGPRLSRIAGGDTRRIQHFRLATLVAVLIPYLLSWLTLSSSLADTVGLAFAVAASTFCPLLVLGVWWPRLSVAGAAAGMASGGALAIAATLVTVLGLGDGGTAWHGWLTALLAQPAAWTVPIAFLVASSSGWPRRGRCPAGPRRRWSACTPPSPSRHPERPSRLPAPRPGARPGLPSRRHLPPEVRRPRRR